ncbi:hypothetical protein [Kaarinaea lacus]
MSNVRPKGLLGIPELRKPHKGSFNPRPKQVDAWLADLPLADTGECARRIYTVLKETNGLQFSYSGRLHVLNALAAPTANILKTLKRHYANQAQPLTAKNRKIAELAIALNGEIATGYKIIIEDFWTSKLSFLNRRAAAEVIHHALYYMNQVLLTAYQIYIDHPATTWMQIHQLYLYAEENNLHEMVVKNKELPENMPACSIRDLYKQIVLLGIISPYRLRQNIIEQVYDALLDWSKHCLVLPPEKFSADANHIKIRLNSDATPGFFNNNETTNRVHTRVIDTSALVHMLSESILHPANLQNAVKNFTLPEDIIKLIVLSWSGKSKRSFSRTPASNTLTITLGLSATHHLVNELLRLNPELQLNGYCGSASAAIFDVELSIDELAALESPDMDLPAEFEQPLIFGAANVKDFANDVWSNDYGSKTIGYDYNLRLWYEQKEKQLKQKHPEYQPVDCNNINESAGGYCLLGYLDATDKSPKVQIGELVGVRDTITSDGNVVGIGTVRRLKNTNNGMELGIQKLASCAEAVAINRYKGNISDAQHLRGLVLPEIKSINQPVSLLTHYIFKVNDELIVNKYGYKTRVKLTKLIESTGVYSQFEFAIVKTIGFAHQNETGKTLNEGEEFENVWTLI